MLDRVQQISIRVEEIWKRIEHLGGSRDSIELVAVTKKFPTDVLQAASDAGLSLFGENYAQELLSKSSSLPEGAEWHFIGGLQRNKVKKLAEMVSVWHTVDRMALIDEISKRAPTSSIFVQVNVTGETQKSGCLPCEAAGLVEHAISVGIEVRGLMVIGPTDGLETDRAFAKAQELNISLGLSELSMGMSADYEKAIQYGSTCIRIGSALFGRRD